MATYDPMQSLAGNLTAAGLAPGNDASSGSLHRFLDPRFLSAIQTAFARAGRQGYGEQEAFNLLSGADRQRAQADPFGYANELLQGSGIQGFSGNQDLMAANSALAGHNASFRPFDPVSSVQQLGGVASDLWSEPGFRGLALTAAGGALAGQATGAGTAAGTTAGTAGTMMPPAGATAMTGQFSMPAAIPVSSATQAASTLGSPAFLPGYSAAYGGGAAAGTSALGGASGGSGLTTPAYGGGTLTGGGVVGGGSGIVGGGAGAVGGGAAAGSGIAGILSSPVGLGALGGAALGGLSGSSEPAGTYTVEEGLPDWLMPYAKPQLDRYATDLQNYQIDPYGVMPSAMQEFQRTVSGQYLDPSTNKYLDDFYRLGAERIKGSLSPSFGHMQAFGSHSGYNEALARGLGDFSTQLFGGAYERERDRQNQMIAAAPGFIGQSGTAAFAPYQQYLTTIGSLGSKKQQPYFQDPWGSALGGAMAGGTLGWMFGGGKNDNKNGNNTMPNLYRPFG